MRSKSDLDAPSISPLEILSLMVLQRSRGTSLRFWLSFDKFSADHFFLFSNGNQDPESIGSKLGSFLFLIVRTIPE